MKSEKPEVPEQLIASVKALCEKHSVPSVKFKELMWGPWTRVRSDGDIEELGQGWHVMLTWGPTVDQDLLKKLSNELVKIDEVVGVSIELGRR